MIIYTYLSSYLLKKVLDRQSTKSSIITCIPCKKLSFFGFLNNNKLFFPYDDDDDDLLCWIPEKLTEAAQQFIHLFIALPSISLL